MFTGITRGSFEVTHVERKPRVTTYVVQLDDALASGLEIGASICIDGVCQTAVEIRDNAVAIDAIEETLRLTTLGELEVGRRVSVERSVKVGDEIGGHDVSGHVIGTGTIESASGEGEMRDLVISVPAEWMKYIQEKGFIAIDGSSLTIGKTDASGRFDLHLIPETLRLTTLGWKQPGDRVNVELDSRTVAIVETVERVLADRFAKGA